MNRRALVTGATSGIGAAFARELATRGWSLVLTGRSTEGLALIGSELDAKTVPADLATPEGRAAVIAESGDVDLLVNNAGLMGTFGPFATMPADELETVLAVDVVAVARLARAVLPGMLAAGRGGIITVSSPTAATAMPGGAAYAASKAFVEALDRSLRAETTGTGLVITTIRPDRTRTAFFERSERTSVHARRWNTPEDVARAALDAHEAGRMFVRIPRRRPVRVLSDLTGTVLLCAETRTLRRLRRASRRSPTRIKNRPGS